MEAKNRENFARNALIFYRLKPSNDFSFENIKVQNDYKVVHACRVQDSSPKIFHTPLYLEYKCDAVFYRQPQRIVYSTIMKDVLARVVEGCDATILSYGQAGSGKTYTMSGLRNCFEDTGIITRFLGEMFELQRKGVMESRIVYKMSYVELIEPTHIKDLLVKACERKIEKLKYQDRLKNASRLVIPSETDALRLLFGGETQRSIESSASYPGANRSHTVLTIYIETKSTIKSQPGLTYGKIHFVDMMGTNCANNIRCHLPPRVQGQANLAKMSLEQYIAHLNQSVQQLPLSQNWTSIVLDYLGVSLNRQAIMRFIGHVHGSAKDLELTHSTLRFGTVVNAVQPLPLARCLGIDEEQQKINDQEELEYLNRHHLLTIANEKELLLSNGKAQLSVARVDHLRRLVQHYLLGKVSEEVIISLNQTPLFFHLCREFISNMKKENRATEAQIQELRKEEEEAVLLHERALLLEQAAAMEREVLASRTSSSFKGLASKSRESQKSICITSKEASGKSIESVKRNASETSKKSKNSAQNRKSSYTDRSSRELLPPDIECPIQRVPSHSTAWAMFVINPDTWEMQEDVRDAEVADKQTNEVYEASKSNVMEASQNLEEARKELYLVQKLRHLSNNEMHTPWGSLISREKERMLNLLFKNREVELNTKMEAMHMNKLLKNKTVDNLRDARMKIETSFQTFCIGNYGVPLPSLGTSGDEKDASVKTNKSFELHYHQMQERILNNSPNVSKTRNQSWYSDKCLSDDLPFKNSI